MKVIDDIRTLAKDAANGKKWEYYPHTTELAEKYRRYVLGEDIDKELKRFVQRESEDQFTQRCNLTKNISTSVCSAVKTVFYKVPRSNGISRTIKYENDTNDKRLTELTNALRNWYAKNDLDSWLPTWFNDLGSIDPNCYIVTEIGNFDNTKERAKTYPFIAFSDMIVNRGWENGVTEWLMVENDIEEEYWQDGQKHETEVCTYTYYDEYRAVKYIQSTDKNILAMFPQDGQEKEITIDGVNRWAFRARSKVYIEYQPTPYNLTELPAYCVGYLTDQLTDGQTFVSHLHAGFPYLEKQLKCVSEMDLTQALHAFPQKFQYLPKCKNHNCSGGMMIDTGETCPNCHGTGSEPIHTTASDAITLRLSDNKDEIIDLQSLVHYEYPPIDLLNFQKEYIEYLTEEMKRAVFNADTYAKTNIAETATEQVIDMQAVYDTLYPYAVHYADTWKSITGIRAEIVELAEGLHIAYHVSKDFKLKSTADLIADIKLLAESNADESILQSVQNDIAVNMFADKPRELIKFSVKKRYEPFAGKNENEAIYALNLLPNTDKYKVLWIYFGVIWDELEREQAAQGVDFWLLEYSKQAELVWAKVAQYTEEMKTDTINEPTY